MCKSKIDERFPIVASGSYIIYPSAEKLEKMYLKEFLKIGADSFSLAIIDSIIESKPDTKLDENEDEPQSQSFLDKKLVLKPSDKNKIMTEIPVKLTKSDEYTDDRYAIEWEFDVGTYFEDKDEVIVEMRRKYLTSKLDNNIFLHMRYPTKDVLLSCELKDGTHAMSGFAFTFTGKANIIRIKENSAFVDIKEWVLPGHGAVISWYPNK